jgi:hypothetical protein
MHVLRWQRRSSTAGRWAWASAVRLSGGETNQVPDLLGTITVSNDPTAGYHLNEDYDRAWLSRQNSNLAKPFFRLARAPGTPHHVAKKHIEMYSVRQGWTASMKSAEKYGRPPNLRRRNLMSRPGDDRRRARLLRMQEVFAGF